MRAVSISPGQFEKIALRHKYKNYYQTPNYGIVMSKFGFDILYVGIVSNNNKLIGGALILHQEIFLNNRIGYAPRGILFDYDDEDNVEEMTKALKLYLNKQKIMLLRMDPYIPLTIRDQNGDVLNNNEQGKDFIDNIINAGFQYKGNNLFFETEKPRWESLILLNKDLREIFSEFDKRTRNKIRKAINSGIEVFIDENKDISTLYKMLNKEKPQSYYKLLIKSFGENVEIYYAKINTSLFIINSRRTYEKELEENARLTQIVQDLTRDPKERNSCLSKKMQSDKLVNIYKNALVMATEMLKKYPDGIIVGGAMNILFDNAAFIIAEGANPKYKNLNVNYILKWKMIEEYNERGFKYVNMNAVVGEFDKRTKYTGLNEMKFGFNPIVTEYIGEFDLIVNPISYNLYKSFGKRQEKQQEN